MRRFVVAMLVLVSGVGSAEMPEGWEVLTGEWTFDGGLIVGRADGGDAWLQMDGFYNDFTLELEFRTPEACNGGVQIRSHWLPKEVDLKPNVFYGYQYNIDTGEKGGTGVIIDQNGDGGLVVASPEAQKAVKATDWNHMRIEARGNVMSLWINGVKANHINDEKFLGGHIALQVMPLEEGIGEIHYRNIKINDLGRTGDWRSIFNGRSLKGWEVYGTERFDVEDGVIIGRSGPKKSEGYLLTKETWTDFRVRGSFKMLGAGNFGLFYRSTITLREKDGYPIISGIQGEVDPAYPGPSGWHYESYRRGWLHEEPQKESMRGYAAPPDTWGEIEIRCIGNRTTSWINGIRIVDFYDPNPQVFEGGFALQLHAGGVEGIMWKDLFVLE
jgi:hypothetical protein